MSSDEDANVLGRGRYRAPTSSPPEVSPPEVVSQSTFLTEEDLNYERVIDALGLREGLADDLVRLVDQARPVALSA